MPFKDSPEGQTHSYNDGCEPPHTPPKVKHHHNDGCDSPHNLYPVYTGTTWTSHRRIKNPNRRWWQWWKPRYTYEKIKKSDIIS